MAQGLSCCKARWIFLNQGSNPCPPKWQTSSYPLYFQGSPSPSSPTQSQRPLQRCHGSPSSLSSYQPRFCPQTPLFPDAFSSPHLLPCPYLPALLHNPLVFQTPVKASSTVQPPLLEILSKSDFQSIIYCLFLIQHFIGVCAHYMCMLGLIN